MKKIIYKGITGYFKQTIYYEIKNDEFVMMNLSKCINKKEALFSQNTESGYKLDKMATEKLFKLLTEDEIKEKFGIEFGDLDFSKYCDKNNIKCSYLGSLD